MNLHPGDAILSTYPIRADEKGAAVIPTNTEGTVLHSLGGGDTFRCRFFIDGKDGVRSVVTTAYKKTIRSEAGKEGSHEKIL